MDTPTLLRFSVFLGGLVLFAALEALFPRKTRVMPRLHRWVTNLSLSAFSSLGLRLLGPLTVAGAALAASQSGLGLFNIIDAPVWLIAAATLILMDLAVWAQHLAMHKLPLFWRMHRVHHTDRDLDVTSGLRFHPFEAAVSMAWKALIVFLLGAPLMVALAYEIILNAMALFTHANLRLPLWLDRALRWVIVTPDMHRIHHSIIRTETDSNYGNALSIWDRIFATYTPEPAAGQEGLTIGLAEWQNTRPAEIGFALIHPLARK